jgi:hypothetical protein
MEAEVLWYGLEFFMMVATLDHYKNKKVHTPLKSNSQKSKEN